MCRCALLACCMALVCATVAVGAPVPTPEPLDFSTLTAESIKKWSGAELLLVGKLKEVTAGPVGFSSPPFRTYRMTISGKQVLRGAIKSDKPLQAGYSVRQEAEPVFPAPDKECLLALKHVRDGWVLQSFEVATMDGIKQAKLATSFPIGWTIVNRKLVSPWAKTGKPTDAKGAVCSVTGRPAFTVGDGISFRIEPVPPAVKLKYGNPDGDGEFKLIVKNDTDKETAVPALLTDGKKIRWDESIIIRCQNKAYPIPGSTGHVDNLKAVVLKPGESVTGTIHAFAIDGPEWPRGGYRIEIQICLGERSATHSFYYLSKHHDPIREAVQKGLKK